MKRKLLIINVLLALSGTTIAFPLSSSLTYNYAWPASPTEDEAGNPLAPVEHYQVWLQCDDDLPVQVATVAGDTTYSLHAEMGYEYRIRVYGVDTLGRCSEPSPWSDPLVIYETTNIPESTAATLEAPFPNPFNPSTNLRYGVPDDLAAGTPVRLRIHDARGALVRELDLDRSPGWHIVPWQGRDQQGRAVASGAYVAHYVCGSMQSTTRLTLVK